MVIGPDVLGGHDVVSAAVCSAGDPRHLWNGGFGERIEELRSVSDDGAPIFVARSITLQIFDAYAPESEPPITVKSCPRRARGGSCRRDKRAPEVWGPSEQPCRRPAMPPRRDRNPTAPDGATPWQGDDPCSRYDKGARPGGNVRTVRTARNTRNTRNERVAETCEARGPATKNDRGSSSGSALVSCAGEGTPRTLSGAQLPMVKCRNSRYVDHLKTGTRGPPSPLRDPPRRDFERGSSGRCGSRAVACHGN